MVEGKDHEIPLQDEVLLKFIVERLKIKQRKEVEEKFGKYFGYLARCEGSFCTTTLKITNFGIEMA